MKLETPKIVGRWCGLVVALVLTLCIVALAVTGTAKVIMWSGVFQ